MKILDTKLVRQNTAIQQHIYDDSLQQAINKITKHTSTDTSIYEQPHVGDYDAPVLKGADRAIIIRTPGDKGSIHDKGYNVDIPLKQYREQNQKDAIGSYIETSLMVLAVVGLIVALIYLLRFAIRRKAIIKYSLRKFFFG